MAPHLVHVGRSFFAVMLIIGLPLTSATTSRIKSKSNIALMVFFTIILFSHLSG